MTRLSPIRLLTVLAAAVLLLLLLLLALLLTDTLLNIRTNLQTAPAWLWVLIIGGFLLFGLASLWVLMRLLRPASRVTGEETPPVLDERTITQRLEQGRLDGIDIRAAEAELERLRQRRQRGDIHVAVYGEISSGKSSLIKALLPQAGVEIAVTGGTTRQLDEYRWTSPAGDRLILTDMPGLNENDAAQPDMAQHEALRAHLVVYVCDSDLSRSQSQQLSELAQLDKPMILVLNKSDRYSESDLQQLRQRLEQRRQALGISELVVTRSGGFQQLVRILPDGREEVIEREQLADVEALQRAIQRHIDGDRHALDALRDSAVFSLITNQLDAAEARQREERAQEITRGYAKKAVIGSVATITPGTDLLIQGYLATRMIRELTELYQAPARDIDIELLLKLVQQHVRSHLTLLLAIAGNAMKAFPGIGTLGGGVVHAVAYGFLFETLGKSIAESLRSRGELHPVQVARHFEDNLSEDIQTSAGHYAKLALRQIKDKS